MSYKKIGDLIICSWCESPADLSLFLKRGFKECCIPMVYPRNELYEIDYFCSEEHKDRYYEANSEADFTRKLTCHTCKKSITYSFNHADSALGWVLKMESSIWNPPPMAFFCSNECSDKHSFLKD